jgi:hypothetical protein
MVDRLFPRRGEERGGRDKSGSSCRHRHIEIVPVLDPNPRVLDADYIQENKPRKQTFPPEI